MNLVFFSEMMIRASYVVASRLDNVEFLWLGLGLQLRWQV
jgi:hypothetical protein